MVKWSNMAMNIKSEEAYRLTRQLAKLTGESLAAAPAFDSEST